MTKSFRCTQETAVLLKDIKNWYKHLYSVELNESQIIISAIIDAWIKYRAEMIEDQKSNKMDN